jgi:hypothetical protein
MPGCVLKIRCTRHARRYVAVAHSRSNPFTDPTHTMLLHGLVYARTARGKSELTSPTFALTSGSRRLLFLVDGQRCTSELAAMTRRGELQFQLFELLVLELIEKVAEVQVGDPRTFSGDVGLTAPGVEHFKTVKGRLALKLFDTLGNPASALIEKLSGATTPIELVTHLNALKGALLVGRTNSEVDRFLQKVARVMIDGAPERPNGPPGAAARQSAERSKAP